ncbi:MAG TPA: glycosyltransferase [Oligoflexia bacterium]|nr:glycosyltransferase [Oligoflexia bacterium]
MRVGIYLGRHAGGGGGIAVYARSLVAELFRLLERQRSDEVELVFYGAKSLFEPALLDELELAPVLFAAKGVDLFFGAASCFRVLPNGAKCRVLIRFLPESFSRYADLLLDQMLVPVLLLRDRVHVLHSAANYGIIAARAAQVVTVHDLYQAWPIESAALKRAQSGCVKPWTALTRMYYRALFAWQFRRVSHVVTDCEEVAAEICRRYKFDRGRISTIPLGLDHSFERFFALGKERGKFDGENAAWLQRNELEPGYVLVFASSDPRKNMARTLEAWLALPEKLRNRTLVLKANSARAKSAAERQLGVVPHAGCWKILPWSAREEMPFLYWNAAVVLVPTLAEGFGLPAVEALACGSVVVSGPHEELAGRRDLAGRLFLCEPEELKSISQALVSALEEADKGRVRLELDQAGAVRLMADAVRETFAVYHRTALRAAR